MEFQIATGNPDLDQQQLAQIQQQYAAAGYSVQATPLPTGGFHVKLVPAGAAPGAAPAGYGAPAGAPQDPSMGAYGAPPGAPPEGYGGAPPAGYGGAPPGAPGAPPGGFGGPPPGAPPGGFGGAPPGAPPGGYGGAPPGAPGAPPGGFGGPPPGAPGAPPGGVPGGAFGQAAGAAASGMMGGALGGAVSGVVAGSSSSGSSGVGFLKNWRVLHGAAVVIAAIAGGAMFLMPDMAVGVLAGIAAGLALVLSVVLVIIARPKILHSIGAVGLSIILGGVAGGVMWFVTHPSVHVDNPTKDTLQIYVDGKAVLTVKPNAHDSVSVHKGKHKFGWAKKGASKPTATVDAEVKLMKAHLYNPNKTGCYWLQVDVYGNVSDGGRAAGPQTIQEFYVFDSVDNWFTENPDFVTVKKKEKGKVKTALQRAKACMQFADCDLAVRVKLIECEKKAFAKDDEKAFEACGDEAERGCASKGGGNASPSAAPTASPKTK